MLLNSLDDAKFKRQNQMIGKVVFLKDRDIEMNPLEKEMSSWVTQFHFKMH